MPTISAWALLGDYKEAQLVLRVNIGPLNVLKGLINEVLASDPTPPNSEIICGQNVGTKVVCGMILFFEKKTMLKI